jgi:hypothetical protein
VNISYVEISGWDDIVALHPEDSMDVYRGHSDSDWELDTAIRRTKLKFNEHAGGHDFLYAERASLRTFKSRAHFYLDDLPDQSDLVSWLSVMQHHGTPTRLLDFTRSFYVALFFAATEATSDFCVWAIEDHWLRVEGANFAKKHGFDYTNGLRFGELTSIYYAANHVLSHNSFGGNEDDFEDESVLLVELDRQIPRLAVQQGCFLMPVALEASFMDNLGALASGKHTSIKRIVIPVKLRDEILMHLRAMNITAEALFPGIDGFARSLIYSEML